MRAAASLIAASLALAACGGGGGGAGPSGPLPPPARPEPPGRATGEAHSHDHSYASARIVQTELSTAGLARQPVLHSGGRVLVGADAGGAGTALGAGTRADRGRQRGAHGPSRRT